MAEKEKKIKGDESAEVAQQKHLVVEGESQSPPVCGIVMPISEIGGCSESHWAEVQKIFREAIKLAGFEGMPVNQADDISVIQKRIIRNLYENPMVICDLSALNPNVMFELGLRLAFDKPAILIIDDSTNFSFDTGSIEHLVYPRDLRYQKILDFQEKLADKIQLTYSASLENKDYSPFLKNYGEFVVANIDKKEVTEQVFILEELSKLQSTVEGIDRAIRRQRNDSFKFRAKEPLFLETSSGTMGLLVEFNEVYIGKISLIVESIRKHYKENKFTFKTLQSEQAIELIIENVPFEESDSLMNFIFNSCKENEVRFKRITKKNFKLG